MAPISISDLTTVKAFWLRFVCDFWASSSVLIFWLRINLGVSDLCRVFWSSPESWPQLKKCAQALSRLNGQHDKPETDVLKKSIKLLNIFQRICKFFCELEGWRFSFLFVGKKRTNIELLSDSNIDKHKHPFKTFFDRIRHDILVMSVKWLDSVTWKLWPQLWRK